MVKTLNAEEKAHLAKLGVPDEVVNVLEDLIDELNGVLVAEGWRDPAGQAQHVAERLIHHAFALNSAARQ